MITAAIAGRSQSPGGVNTSITAWFKANTAAGNLVMNGGNVAEWKSDVNMYSATQTTASRQPLLVTTPLAANGFNFNPSLQFSQAASRSLNNTNASPDLLGTNGTMFMIVNTNNYAASSSSCFAYMSNSSYRYQVKAHFRIQTGNNGTGYTADFNPQFPQITPMQQAAYSPAAPPAAIFSASEMANVFPSTMLSHYTIRQ